MEPLQPGGSAVFFANEIQDAGSPGHVAVSQQIRLSFVVDGDKLKIAAKVFRTKWLCLRVMTVLRTSRAVLGHRFSRVHSLEYKCGSFSPSM